MSDLIPEHDTPFDQATPAEKAAWANKNVTLIPGRSTIAGFRKAPAVENRARAVAQDAEGLALGTADFLQNALQQWAAAHGQVGLYAYVTPGAEQNGPDFQALNSGASSLDIPDCAAYPSSLVLVPLTPTIASAIGANDASLLANYRVALLQSFDAGGRCDYVAHFGNQARVIASYSGTVRLLSAIKLRLDPVIGSLLDVGGAADCSQLSVSICSP